MKKVSKFWGLIKPGIMQKKYKNSRIFVASRGGVLILPHQMKMSEFGFLILPRFLNEALSNFAPHYK